MLTEEQIRKEIAIVVGQRDQSRQELVANRNSHPDVFQALCVKQAVILGKLGGLYVALGKHPNLINQMVADPYWQGLTEAPQKLDPDLE